MSFLLDNNQRDHKFIWLVPTELSSFLPLAFKRIKIRFYKMTRSYGTCLFHSVD